MTTRDKNIAIANMLGWKVTWFDKLFYTYKLRFDSSWETQMEALRHIFNLDTIDGKYQVDIVNNTCTIWRLTALEKIKICEGVGSSENLAIFEAIYLFTQYIK